MKITKKQARELLPTLKRAVAAQEESWDAQGELEAELGKTFSNLGEMISDMAVSGSDAITVQDAYDVLLSLEEE